MWNRINVHRGLIYKDTGNAVLIQIPKEINDKSWCIWVPKSLIKFNKELDNEVVFEYPPSFEFKIEVIGDNTESKIIEESEFVSLFKGEYVSITLAKNTLVEEVDNIIYHYDKLRASVLRLWSEEKVLDKVFPHAITEEDIDYMDKKFSELIKYKKRWISLLDSMYKDSKKES